MNLDWKLIDKDSNSDEFWYLLDVEGGYILRHKFYNAGQGFRETVVFVPIKPKEIKGNKK